jgi:hypothetical protein
VPCPDMDLQICADIVHPSVPLLFGFDILDKQKLNVLSVANKIHSAIAGWTLPLVRQQGHLYLKCYPHSETFYSRQQLYRLHKHLFHPSADKLLNLLKRANPTDTKDYSRTFQNLVMLARFILLSLLISKFVIPRRLS